MISANVLANAMNTQMQRSDLLDATTQKLEQMAKGNMTKENAQKVAKEFEALFISQMLEHMMSGDTLGKEMFGSAESEEIYKGMMMEQYSKAIVKSGGIGIAQNLEKALIERSLANRELLKTQEVVS